jgi:hypothetical protein
MLQHPDRFRAQALDWKALIQCGSTKWIEMKFLVDGFTQALFGARTEPHTHGGFVITASADGTSAHCNSIRGRNGGFRPVAKARAKEEDALVEICTHVNEALAPAESYVTEDGSWVVRMPDGLYVKIVLAMDGKAQVLTSQLSQLSSLLSRLFGSHHELWCWVGTAPRARPHGAQLAL